MSFGAEDNLTNRNVLWQKHLEQLSLAKINSLHRLLKKGVWAYFLLLVFEGALRKWFLPGLSTPLLIVRDPLVIWLLYTSWKSGFLQFNFYMQLMAFIGILALIFTLILGHGNLPVALFGARILLLHFPMMFVIGCIFERDDVIKIGRVVLMIAIPMAILIALQFYSPQNAWVNRGVGGDTAGAGFSGALGYFRPPGTFSFTTGNAQFFSLVACFVFYFWINPGKNIRLLLVGATAALLVAIPLSISRTLLFQVSISTVFAIIIIYQKPKYFRSMILAFFFITIVLALLNMTGFFQRATKAFNARFEMASDIEGGIEGTLIDRFFGGMVSAIGESGQRPFFGYGIGLGTNVGSMLLTGGNKFLISEEEWARLIGEMGALMGLAVISIRLAFLLNIGLASYSRVKSGDFLPWMLLSFGMLMVAQGQWAQPTALGFSTLIGGLMISALHKS